MTGLPDVVYVIDDDESFLRALLRLLRLLGLRASGFSSPDALNASLPLPDRACLIVDIFMGRHNGMESYCQIWCLRFSGHAAIWSFCVSSIPSLNLTPVMTLAR
jgi:hypothetical protein